MMSKTASTLLPLLLCAPLLAKASTLTLDDALRQAGDGSGVSAATAQLQARYAARDQRDSEAGWEMFGNANVGHYHELVTQDLTDNYYGRDLAIGLRYPLLGSLRRRMDAVQTSEHDARLGEIEQGYQRARQRLAVRSAYADWWRATQESQLCQGVQEAARDAEKQVRQRLDGHWILPSDAQLMHSEWTAVTRRCDSQADLLEDVRASLQSLGVQVQPGDTPVASALASHPQPLGAWQAQLENNPRMARRNADLASAEQTRQRPWYSAIESYFSVTQSVEQRSGADDNGNGLSVGVTFSAPVDLMDYGSARGREGEARYQAAVQAQENERGTLLRELGKVLQQQRRSTDEYAWRSERRKAVDQIIAERRQRTRLDAGEASLHLLQAEVDHYNAGFAQIAAWHAAWLQDSALRLFGDESPAFEALLGPGVLQWQGQASASGWRLGTYVWHSAALLDPAQQATQLRDLHHAGIGQIDVGLDRAQLAEPTHTQAALAQLLLNAHAQGLQVNLLLGDPAWITPAGRPGLISLIEQLRALPFDGLHLDLEVEQLGWPVPDPRLTDWLATLAAARHASPWPLNISSHPRWFAAQTPGHPCVPCQLQGMGIGQVSLMIFNRNPHASSTQALAIARQWPALHFRLAQSVEADQPTSLSWTGANAEQLRTQADAWRTTLQPAGLTGIDWQSWTDFPRTR